MERWRKQHYLDQFNAGIAIATIVFMVIAFFWPPITKAETPSALWYICIACSLIAAAGWFLKYKTDEWRNGSIVIAAFAWVCVALLNFASMPANLAKIKAFLKSAL